MKYGLFFNLPDISSEVHISDLDMIARGDILLFYPRKMNGGQLAIHIYQNYRGFRYFDNLCTHAAIVRDKGNIIDAMPDLGVSIRPITEIDNSQILRLRRFTRLSDTELSLFVETAESLVGAGYGWMGLFGGASGLSSVLAKIQAAAYSISGADHSETDKVADTGDALRSFYCSQLIEYCYTKIKRKTFSDCAIAEIFPPSAISLTNELRDVIELLRGEDCVSPQVKYGLAESANRGLRRGEEEISLSESLDEKADESLGSKTLSK